MSDTATISIQLPSQACPTLVGALWALAAQAAPDDQSTLLGLAALVHVAHCRALRVDPRGIGTLLIGLPPRLRAAYTEQLDYQARLPMPS